MEAIPTETIKIEPESILVYTPARPMTEQWWEHIYNTLEQAACKALACDPQHLPVGIIILKPGDTLVALPSTKLLAKIEERLKSIEEKVGK